MQDVFNDEGLKDVQLEVTVASSDSHSHVVSDDLSADHSDGFALGGVDLSGHDGAARLVFGKAELTETAARSRSQESNIVGNFHDGDSEGVESTTQVDKSVLGGESLELVGGSDKGMAGFFLQVLNNSFSKASVGVEASSDSGTTLSNLVDINQSLSNTLLAVLELVNVGRELLSESKGSGILSVSSSDFDNVGEFVTLLSESFPETSDLGEEAFLDFEDSGDVHDRREGVVGGLGAVDVIVGVDELGAELSAENLDGTVGNNFVGVHVGLSAGTSLPDNKGEVVVELTFGDFGGSFDNGASDLRVETVVEVSLGSGFLQDTESTDDGERHTLGLTANLEVLQRSLSLCSPVTVSRHVNGSESVAFFSELASSK